MERKKRSKGSVWEFCYANKIFGTYGFEIRALGQKFVKFCAHTHKHTHTTAAKLVVRIVKSRMKWAGHMVRMNDDKLPKRVETKRQEGSRKRGRPQLRWEDCVKRDLRKAKEEEKWREKANNRDRWKLITKAAVLRSDQ